MNQSIHIIPIYKIYIQYRASLVAQHKESVCNAGDVSLIPELGRSPAEGKGYPLQDSGLENSWPV